MNMNNEKIIRDEAKEFYQLKIEGLFNPDPVEDIYELKSRLTDFYSPEFKSVFLDEIERLINIELEEHVKTSHDGILNSRCGIERYSEKILECKKRKKWTFNCYNKCKK